MADPEPRKKPRRLRPPARHALAAKYSGTNIADPNGLERALHRASINFGLLKAANIATLDQTRKELSPLVGALEKLKSALERDTAAQRRAMIFVEMTAQERALAAKLVEFLDFVPEAERIFRDALNRDAREIDIPQGKSKTPHQSLVGRLMEIHGQYVGPQIPENEFVLWALNEELQIRNDDGSEFSKDAVRQLRHRAATKNPRDMT